MLPFRFLHQSFSFLIYLPGWIHFLSFFLIKIIIIIWEFTWELFPAGIFFALELILLALNPIALQQSNGYRYILYQVRNIYHIMQFHAQVSLIYLGNYDNTFGKGADKQ